MSSLADPLQAAEAHVRSKVKLVANSEADFGPLSTGERIAVALVLDRHDLLQLAWGGMLESVDRLGPLRTQAALRVQRQGLSDTD
jgi:hypothetical protein